MLARQPNTIARNLMAIECLRKNLGCYITCDIFSFMSPTDLVRMLITSCQYTRSFIRAIYQRHPEKIDQLGVTDRRLLHAAMLLKPGQYLAEILAKFDYDIPIRMIRNHAPTQGYYLFLGDTRAPEDIDFEAKNIMWLNYVDKDPTIDDVNTDLFTFVKHYAGDCKVICGDHTGFTACARMNDSIWIRVAYSLWGQPIPPAYKTGACMAIYSYSPNVPLRVF